MPFPCAETDVTDLQARMSAGELDHPLTQAYLQRIATLDAPGRACAVIDNPDALKEAAARRDRTP